MYIQLSLLLLAVCIRSTLQQEEHRCAGKLCSQSQPICCKKVGSSPQCVNECTDGVVMCPQSNCTLTTSQPFCCKPRSGGQMQCVSDPQQCKQQPCGYQSCTKEAPHCCGDGLSATCVADPSSCTSGLRCGKNRCFPAAPYCCRKKGQRPRCTATAGDCHKCGSEICYPDSDNPICCYVGATPYCVNSTLHCVYRKRCKDGHLCPIGASHCCSSTWSCVSSVRDCPPRRPRLYATAPKAINRLRNATATDLMQDMVRHNDEKGSSELTALPPKPTVSSTQADQQDSTTAHSSVQTETESNATEPGDAAGVMETSRPVTQHVVITTSTRKTTSTVRPSSVKKGANNDHVAGKRDYPEHPELFVEDEESHQQHITIVTVVVCIGGFLCVLILIKSLKQYKRKRQTTAIDDRLDPRGRFAFQSTSRMSIQGRRYR